MATEQKADTKRTWPKVELAIDVLDDPPRPFFADVFDETPGSNWRENDEYRTETYVPLSTLEKETAEREAAEVERDDALAKREATGRALRIVEERNASLLHLRNAERLTQEDSK